MKNIGIFGYIEKGKKLHSFTKKNNKKNLHLPQKW